MAYEGNQLRIQGATAGADLSTSQFRLVQKNTSANAYALANAIGEHAHGVLQNKPTSGQAAVICAVGVTKVRAGGALTAGDQFTTDASGQAITRAATSIDDSNLGHVIEGASAAGELATVFFNPQG